MIYTIDKINWHKSIAEYLRSSKDGDTILVHTEAQRDLALSAKSRMCPEKNVNIGVDYVSKAPFGFR